MRFARNFLLLTLALGAAACSDEDLGPTSAAIPPLAYVRYINATPDTLNHTVRWVDDLEYTPQTFVNVGFRELGQGGWQGLAAGSRHFKVFTYQQNVLNFPVAGNTTVLKDTTFNFVAGQHYTILFTGYSRTGQTPAAQLRIFEDTPAPSPATGTLIRVYNLAYGVDFDAYAGQQAAYLDTNVIAPVPPSTTPTLQIFQRDTIVGESFTSAELGTLIGSGAAANVGTASQAYTARASGVRSIRLTPLGATTSLGIRTVAPAGLAETVDFEAAGGTNIAGSVLTVWVFPRKTAGSPNSTGVINARPNVLVTIDRSPARTVAP